MRYYLSPSKDTILQLSKSINPPSCWDLIPKEKYLELEQNNYKKNQPFLLNNNVKIAECYDYYYSKWIYYLINEGKCKYIWFKPNEHNFLLHDTFSFCLKTETNKFILDNKDNPKNLGEDILKNGTYFPFIFNQTDNLKEIKVHLGFHRIYSLSMLNTNKEFLGLYFPFESYEDFLQKVNSKNDPFLNISIPYYILDPQNNSIFSGITSNLTNLNYFFTFSDDLAPILYDFKDIIKPNPIWNNKDLFEQWIKTPFKINSKLE